MYVIAASAEGPVKLGISADPDQRLRQLQTGQPARLTVYYREPIAAEKVRLFERLLHRDHAHVRLCGEWFNMTVEHAIAYVQVTVIDYDGLTLEALQREIARKPLKLVKVEH